MKSRSNHKFSGAHPFLAHWIIRKELYFVCCLHHHCLLGRRNYWPNVLSFNTRFHFRSGKMFLRQGALLDIFLDEGSVLNYSWNFPQLLFFFFICSLSNPCFLWNAFEISSANLYSLGPLNCFPWLPEDCNLSWGNF